MNALNVLYAQLTRDLFAIAKFLCLTLHFYLLYLLLNSCNRCMSYGRSSCRNFCYHTALLNFSRQKVKSQHWTQVRLKVLTMSWMQTIHLVCM